MTIAVPGLPSVLRDWIAAAPPGARLPSTRVPGRRAPGQSRDRAEGAARPSPRQGLIESRPGVGTFVRAVRTARPADYGWQTAALRSPQAPLRPVSTAMRSAPNDVIAFHSGYPDRELLPERLVRAALTRAARGDAALSRPPGAGLPELQSWFAHELGAATPGRRRPAHAERRHRAAREPERAQLRSSAPSCRQRAAAADGVPDVLGGHPGGRAGRASGWSRCPAVPTAPTPTSWRAPSTRPARGCSTRSRTTPTPPARSGRPNAPNRCWTWCATTAPSSSRTTGPTISASPPTPRPVAAHDDAGHVVYLRSLTKSVSPALRIAAVIARGPARERILADRGAESMYVSGVLQAAALDVVTQPAWQTHLRGLRQQLRARRDLLVGSLREHAPPAHVDRRPHGRAEPVGAPARRDRPRPARPGLRARRGLIAPGTEWFPAEPAGPFLRLNYAGPNPAAFPEGARILGKR